VRYNPHTHHHRSIRVPAYDYAQAAAYFITICTHNRELLLDHRLMRQIVSDVWRELARRFPSVRLDQFVLMPNHIHGIIWITAPTPPAGAQHGAWPDNDPSPSDTPSRKSPPPSNHAAPRHPAAVKPNSVGLIVRAFKSRAAKRINRLRRTPSAPVWQRNYYEHIIRDEEDLYRIRQYIIDNPAKWAEDTDNPTNWRIQASERYSTVGAQRGASAKCRSS
jgi:putative transposase